MIDLTEEELEVTLFALEEYIHMVTRAEEVWAIQRALAKVDLALSDSHRLSGSPHTDQ